MPEPTSYVQPLNGLEVVDDLCGFIADKLRTDCNLREIDGYSSGYKAKVTIHLELFGLDTSSVDQEIVVNSVAPESQSLEPDDVVDTEIEIPQEEDLSVVRDRSGQAEPNVEISSEGPVALPQGRKYTRRLKALGQARGGATVMPEE